VRFTDTQRYFVSEASVDRLVKAHDLITSPAFIVIQAANEGRDKTTTINQMWQTDFTYIKTVSWGWYFFSTILDDLSRYVVAASIVGIFVGPRRSEFLMLYENQLLE